MTIYVNGSALGGGGGSVTTDATLTGSGTVASPLGVALSHANTWTGAQTFGAGLIVSSGQTIASAAGGDLVSNVPTGHDHIFNVNAVESVRIGAGLMVGTTTDGGAGSIAFPRATGSLGVINAGTYVAEISLSSSFITFGNITFDHRVLSNQGQLLFSNPVVLTSFSTGIPVGLSVNNNNPAFDVAMQSGAQFARFDAGVTDTPTATQTANYQILQTNSSVAMNPAGGSLTATLPAASTVPLGWYCWVYDAASGAGAGNTITIATTGGDTLVGSATINTVNGTRMIKKTGATRFQVMASA